MEDKNKTSQNQNTGSSNNIDSVINEVSYEIARKISKNAKYQNEVDKALGVLVNDGLYAYYVYVKTKIKKDSNEKGNIFIDELRPLLKFIKVEENEGQENALNEKCLEKLSKDLNNLLFFRDLVERVLVYVRYYLKAMGD